MPIKEKDRRKSPQAGEAGFTLIEMIIVMVIASILGIFIFGVLTKCLRAQRDMQVRKERSDDAILSMERMNRELREARWIVMTGTNRIVFEKNITSSADTNRYVAYVRDPATNTLLRQSAATIGGLSWIGPPDFISPTGIAIATEVWYFYSVDVSNSRIALVLKFTNGSDWQTRVFPRNYNL